MVSVSSNPDLKWNIVQQCTSCTQKSPEHNSACSLQRRRTHSCRSWDRPRCCRAARSRRCRWRPPCAPSPPPPARRPARPGAPWATGLGRKPRIYTQTCKRERSCSGNKVFSYCLALHLSPFLSLGQNFLAWTATTTRPRRRRIARAIDVRPMMVARQMFRPVWTFGTSRRPFCTRHKSMAVS